MNAEISLYAIDDSGSSIKQEEMSAPNADMICGRPSTYRASQALAVN